MWLPPSARAKQLDGCGAAELCDYDAFAKLTEEIIPTAAECGFA